jgi:hypothetical protein
MKSFVSDLKECELPESSQKQIFRHFFFFYSAKAQFHFDNLQSETDGLATYVQLFDETGEVQVLIEELAARF